MTPKEMAINEKLDQAIEKLDQKKKALLLNILELQAKGIKIVMLLNGRPVLEKSEFAKLEAEMLPYFQDDFAEER